MGTKTAIDQRKRREYRNQINQYGALIRKRYDDDKMSEDKFWRLAEKLDQWYKNYTPYIVVQDFAQV